MRFRHVLACGLALPLSIFAVAQSAQPTPAQPAAPAQTAAPAQSTPAPSLQLHTLPPPAHTATPQELEQQKEERLRTGLINLARAEASWGPPDSAKGMALALKEMGRTKNAAGATEIRYQITGTGFTPDMQLTLLHWPLNQSVQQVMSGIVMDASGTAVCGVAGPGPSAPTDAAGAKAKAAEKAAPSCAKTMKPGAPIEFEATAAKGEPVRVALVAADRTHGAAVTEIPFPIEATDRGCKLSVVLGSKNAELVLVEGQGFKEDKTYSLGTESFGDKHPMKVAANANGHFVAAVTPWEPGHEVGDTTAYYQSTTCAPTVSFHWGKDTYKPE